MKMKFIWAVALAAMAFASCSKEDNAEVAPEPGVQGSKAYLSVAINMPQNPGTYADSGPVKDHGTTEEQGTAGGVYVVGFDSGDNKLAVYKLELAEQGTIGVGSTAAAAGDAFQVSEKLAKIFVVINPTTATLAQINAAINYAAMNQAITSESVADMTADNKFMMTSAGKAPGDKGLVGVTPVVAASESAADIATAKAAAKAASYSVSVDRAMAKVTLAAFDAANVKNGTGDVSGFLLNTTNKSYYPYAELVNYSLTFGGPNVADAKYRMDPNYGTVADFATAFNWKKNPDTYTDWKAQNASEYCLENTMAADAQNYNTTTKMIIKARFAPTGVDLGDSWFRVGGIVKTFDELDADYTAAKNAATQNTDLMSKYSSFLDAVLGADRTKGWTEEGKAEVVALADLDAVANGGYLAAKATDYAIEYFQKSVCYYDVNIKHDNRVAATLLGRWGVVRNNWYTLTVNEITQAGKPYIPDPTDPGITDPTNPDPTEPDPDDEKSAFISVTISVNPWTTWNQEVNL